MVQMIECREEGGMILFVLRVWASIPIAVFLVGRDAQKISDIVVETNYAIPLAATSDFKSLPR